MKRTHRTGTKTVYWTKTRCFNEAKKFDTLKDFKMYAPGAHNSAKKNGWLKDYTWLKKRHFWTVESALEESKNYTTITEFIKKARACYNFLLREKKLDEITWFIEWSDELLAFSSDMMTKARHMLNDVGVTATREWLRNESANHEKYTDEQCRLLRRYSEAVNEKWYTWKKHAWYLFPDEMDFKAKYKKMREEGKIDYNFDPDDLHIKP